MKTIVLIVLGLGLMVTQAIAQNHNKDSMAVNDKTGKVHFKISYKANHNSHLPGIGIIQKNLCKGYQVTIPHDANKQGLTIERLQERKTNLSPMFLSSSYATYGSPRQFDFCSSPSAAGTALYQCSAGKVRGKVFHPEIMSANKLADITNDDGGMDISLTRKTSITMDFGYGSGIDSANDMTTDMDDADYGLVNLGFEIGIK